MLEANLCDLIYDEWSKVSSTIESMDNVTFYKFGEIENVEFMKVVINDFDAYMVFRGTDEIQDWVYNFDIRQEYGYHEGFYRLYKLIKKDVSLFENQYENITFTGHSLGGALATICAVESGRGRLVTFGSPRVLTRWRKQQLIKYNIPVSRYVYGCDIVSKLPPPIRFVHTPGLIYINRLASMPFFSNSSVEDHLMFNYKERLLNA